MRRLFSALIVASLLAGATGNALAHPGGPHFAPPFPPPLPMPRHHHHHGPRVGAAVALGLGGLAIGATIGGPPPMYVAPAPVYVAPPPMAVYGGPPPNVIARYYCPPYGQYFPFVRQCPGGWVINPNF